MHGIGLSRELPEPRGCTGICVWWGTAQRGLALGTQPCRGMQSNRHQPESSCWRGGQQASLGHTGPGPQTQLPGSPRYTPTQSQVGPAGQGSGGGTQVSEGKRSRHACLPDPRAAGVKGEHARGQDTVAGRAPKGRTKPILTAAIPARLPSQGREAASPPSQQPPGAPSCSSPTGCQV